MATPVKNRGAEQEAAAIALHAELITNGPRHREFCLPARGCLQEHFRLGRAELDRYLGQFAALTQKQWEAFKARE
eukprot:1864551-Rhodomonas_salina.1